MSVFALVQASDFSREISLENKIVFFDVPAQALSGSVIEFGSQASVNVIVAANLVSEHQSNSVYGRYSLKRALEIFLEGTPFRFRFSEGSDTVIFEEKLTVSTLVTKSSVQKFNREVEDLLVVSARRREESIFDVPISISLLGGDALSKKGVQNIVQLSSSLTNTSLSVARGTNTTLVAYIRGIGQPDPLPGHESGVGIYIDDIYLNRPQGAVMDIYDIERIEVLRGPQGTLYGRNTIGGAIKYVTKRLSEEPELWLKGGIGTYNQKDIVITAGTPVAGGVLRVGGSLAAFNRGGFGENIETGEDHYDKDIIAARLSLEVLPSDYFSLRLSLDHTYDRSSPKPGFRAIASQINLNEGGNVDERFSEVDDNGDVYLPLGSVFDSRAGATEQGHPINKNKQMSSGGALTIAYGLSDELEFRSITAFRVDEQESPVDFDGLPSNSFDTHVTYSSDQFSQELQWIYEGSRVQGLLGGYYLDADALGVFDLILGGFESVSLLYADVGTKTWAAYLDANIVISDVFDVSVGARYTSDRRAVTLGRKAYFNVFSSPYFQDGFIDTSGFFKGARTDGAITPRLSFSWAPTENVHVYGVYSEGFKGGGFDPRATYTTAAQREGFGPETLYSYELGLKSKFWDGVASSTLAVFYSDYRRVQIQGEAPDDQDGDGVAEGVVSFVTNDGKARITGLEYEFTAYFGGYFQLEVNLGLINAEYLEYFVGSGDGEPVNFASQVGFRNTPERTFGLALSYEIPLFFGEFSSTASANYSSSVKQFSYQNEFFDQPGYTLINASLNWRSNGGRWEVGLSGFNLSNKEYVVAAYHFIGLGGQGSASSFYGDPRTVTATFKYHLF